MSERLADDDVRARLRDAERIAELEAEVERLNDERLAEIEEAARGAGEYGPDAQEAAEEILSLVAEVRVAREREAAIIGTGQIVTLAIEDGRRALTSWCSLGDCECPVHEEPAPPAGTYVTVRMDGDPAVKFGRVRITWEPVTEGDDDDQ